MLGTRVLTYEFLGAHRSVRSSVKNSHPGLALLQAGAWLCRLQEALRGGNTPMRCAALPGADCAPRPGLPHKEGPGGPTPSLAAPPPAAFLVRTEAWACVPGPFSLGPCCLLSFSVRVSAPYAARILVNNCSDKTCLGSMHLKRKWCSRVWWKPAQTGRRFSGALKTVFIVLSSGSKASKDQMMLLRN